MTGRNRALLAALVTLTSGVLAGCGGETTRSEVPEATTLTLSETAIAFDFINQTKLVSASVRDQNGDAFQTTIEWSSDDPSVAAVSETGTVRAVSNGTTAVRADAGSLTATVQVTVEQVPAFVLIVSGDNQEAVAGNALPEPLVVRATDRGGVGVEGVAVDFTTSSGSLSVTSGDSDADGLLQTSWTLGSQFGPQTVIAAASVDSTEFSAFARSETPIADLRVASALTFVRVDPSSLEDFTATVRIVNDGDLATGAPFRVALLADGTEVATVDVPALGIAEEASVDLVVPALSAGLYDMTLVADADDVIPELDETNNDADKSLRVVQQTSVGVGATTSALAATSKDDELLFRVDIPPGSPPTLTVSLAGIDSGEDPDIYIEGGPRPRRRADYDDCISERPPGASEFCQIVDAAGTYHILLHAFEPFTGLTMTVQVGNQIIPYDIEVVFIDNGTATQDAAVQYAADTWMTAIVGDVPDADFSTNPIDAGACISGQPTVNDLVDDVRIFVVIDSIDGPGDTLASAGPCYVRGVSRLPIIGSVRFDEADLERLEADGDLLEVVLHEMGHVLGIGTIWQARGLLQDPSLGNDPNDPADDNPGADTHYRGERSIAAFDAVGGASYLGAKVPVENASGPGSGDSHWRESVFVTELMTPRLNSQRANPLSAITIESLADLGYGVDVSAAQTYTLPSTAPIPLAPGSDATIDLRGDIRGGPIVVVDGKGRVLRVLR